LKIFFGGDDSVGHPFVSGQVPDQSQPAALDSDGGKPGDQPPSDPLSARRLGDKKRADRFSGA
jgi:hypothetical protein